MNDVPSNSAVQLWGGVEPSINRVGDSFQCQLEKNGHLQRIDDLDRIANLGIRTLRFPLLWEQLAPDKPGKIDWRWADQWMSRLRELGITPIVGLVHHGSGPRYTSLVDPTFPALLAQYARAVAERFPWVTMYTPVNEVLTTARFSCLYGFWYPHHRTPRSFATAFFNEILGVKAAMAAIREVQPAAQLVQTEDLGQTFCVPKLQYQADFENERRWMTFDFLTGQLQQDGKVWSYLRYVGVPEEEIRWVVQDPCPPDILGINHYLTSNRWLDDDLSKYPPHLHGSNHLHEYVDTEAVRVEFAPQLGVREMLRQTWARYGLPLAITENCLDCTREEQLRWTFQGWQAATELAAEGVPVRGCCAWSLLGCHDWDSLLVEARGHYQVGAFDLRGGSPRPTALTRVLHDLATTGTTTEALAHQPGWWQRDVRLLNRQEEETIPPFDPPFMPATPEWRHLGPLLILGRDTMLGQAFARLCHLRGLSYQAIGQPEVDGTGPRALAKLFQEYRPWAVVNATTVCPFGEPVKAARYTRQNVQDLAEILGHLCRERRLGLLFFSSAAVFDGRLGSAYTEDAATCPVTPYGAHLTAAESVLLADQAQALILRSGPLLSPWYKDCQSSVNHHRLRLPETLVVSPTYVPQLVNAALDLLIDGESGIWHLANEGAILWREFCEALTTRADFDADRLQPAEAESGAPSQYVLTSNRAPLLTAWSTALDQYLYEIRHS